MLRRALLGLGLLHLVAAPQTFFTDFVLPEPTNSALVQAGVLAFLASLNPAYNSSHVTVTAAQLTS